MSITKLPDGSAFFTAEVMTEDEALALPIEQRPICFRLSSEIYHAVFETIGAASMCWNPPPSIEVFDSSRVESLAVELLFKIAKEKESVTSLPTPTPTKPHLQESQE